MQVSKASSSNKACLTIYKKVKRPEHASSLFALRAMNSFKDRLQNYLRFCFQNSLSFKAFWKQSSVSYFVTIPKQRINHEISANRPRQPSMMANAVLFSSSEMVYFNSQR